MKVSGGGLFNTRLSLEPSIVEPSSSIENRERKKLVNSTFIKVHIFWVNINQQNMIHEQHNKVF